MSINNISNKYKGFASQRNTLENLMSRSEKIVSTLNMTQFKENIAALQRKVHNDSFKIMVVGTFKNGKSTFINSFLGEEILPAYSIPCTAVINEVKYGETKKAILHFKNPLPQKLPSMIPQRSLMHMKAHNMQDVKPLEIPYDEIEDYVVIPMGEDPEEMLLESPYEKVELFWPLELLKNGVEIIDSPGLNEHATRTKVTLDYLTKSDAILMVLNSTVLCSEKEMNFIEDDLKGQGYTDPFFVVNRFDLIPKREQDMVKRFATLKLKDYTSFGQNGIYYVSSLNALDSKIENDAQLYQSSGMDVFEQQLSEFLIKSKGKVKLAQPARELKRILNDEASLKVVPMQRKMLNTDLSKLIQKHDQIKPKLDDLVIKKDQIHSKLMLQIEQSRYEFERVVNRNILTLTDYIVGWIDEYELKTSIGIIPSKEKTAAAIKELTDHITELMEESQKQWRKDTLTKLIEEKAAQIFDSAEHDVARIFDEVDKIHVDISGGECDTKTVPTWQRVVGVVGGLAIGDIAMATSGGINGIGKDLAKTFAFEVGAGFVLGLFGLLNPFTLGATIIGAMLFNFSKGQSNAVAKLKEGVSANIIEQLEKSAQDTAKDVSQAIVDKFTAIADQIVSALDIEIKEVNSQMQTAIQQLKQGRENVSKRENEINECETEIKHINNAIDELIFSLVKG